MTRLEEALRDRIEDLTSLLDQGREKLSDFANGLDWLLAEVATGGVDVVKQSYVLTVPFLIEAGKHPNANRVIDRSQVLKDVEEKLVQAVEDELSMGHGAWDMVDPTEIIQAVLKVCLLRGDLS